MAVPFPQFLEGLEGILFWPRTAALVGANLLRRSRKRNDVYHLPANAHSNNEDSYLAAEAIVSSLQQNLQLSAV
jgi:hypothetical protein